MNRGAHYYDDGEEYDSEELDDDSDVSTCSASSPESVATSTLSESVATINLVFKKPCNCNEPEKPAE